MHQNPGLVRFLFLMACGASFICIFISLERGSWLAGLFVLLGLLVLYPKPMLRFLLVAGVVMLILGMGFFSQQVTLATQRLGERGPIDARIVVTDAMFQMIKLKPAFGWGYDTLNQNIAQYYRHVGAASIDLVFTTSHNTYLTILTELGIIGFLLYMLPVIWLLLKSFVVYKHSFNRTFKYNLLIAVFWLGALQNFIVSNFMDMRFFPIGLTLWWLSMGLIANLLNQYEETQKAQVLHGVRGKMPSNRSFDEQLLGHSET
jgi:O-antigen ligase